MSQPQPYSPPPAYLELPSAPRSRSWLVPAIVVVAVFLVVSACALIFLALPLVQRYREAQRRVPIQAVLNRDTQIVQQLQSRIDGGASQADAVDWMVGEFRSVDDTACPADFREARLRFIQACEGLEDQLRSEPQSFGEGVLTGFLNGLRGQFDGGAGEIMDARRERLEELRRAWNEVEASAMRNGVDIRNGK